MGEHTPGPWRVALHDHGDGEEWCVSALNEGGFTDHIIAWANPGNDGDARLIAAAPDLLAALERFVAVDEADWSGIDHGYTEPANQARAAIAKAKGEA